MSESVKHPINEKPYQNVDEIVLDQFNSEMFDAFIDDLGNTNKRQGLKALLEIATFRKIDGLFWWENQQLIIVVSEGQTFKITGSTGAVSNLTGDLLELGARPTFTDNGDTLVMANGGKMVKTDGVALTAFIVDADAPTKVTHVAFLDQFILANEVGTGRFHFADFVGDPDIWFAIDVFTAEANPDNLIALYVNKRIIYLIGTQSIEFWANNGIDPFIRLQGTTTGRGVIGKHSTVFVNEVAYFLDDRRRFVSLVGTDLKIISTPFDKTIQNFDTVDDVLSDYVTIDGRHFILLTFPTEDRTLVYDLGGDYWGEWSYWDQGNNIRRRFLGNAYVYARGFNLHVFGSFRDGKIYTMSKDFFSDDGDDILFEKITGHIDYDTPDKDKISYKLTMRLKSGTGIGLGGNTEPNLQFSFRDNGNPQFGNVRFISLKTRGNTAFIRTIRNLGRFKTRQIKVRLSDQVPLVIGKTLETIDVAEF